MREGLLQQNALNPVDAYSPVAKQVRMLELILHFHERAESLIKQGAPIVIIHDLPLVNTLIQMKTTVENDHLEKLDGIRQDLDKQLDQLEADYK